MAVKRERKTPGSNQVKFNPKGAEATGEAINPSYTNAVASGFISSRYKKDYPVKKYLPDSVEAPSELQPGVASIVNRYALFQYKGPLGAMGKAGDYLDTPDSKIKALADFSKNPTTSNIIQTINDLEKQGMSYSWGDFLYAKYHGKIPNNYLITVRRYAFPQVDNLWDPTTYDHKTKKVVNTDQPEIARAVTYMGEATGNPLENFVSWSNKFNWEEIESQMQVIQSNSQGIQGSSILGIGTTGFGLGAAVSSAATLGSGTNTAAGRETKAAAGFDALKETYPNYVEGPLNVIKKLTIQGQGLEFTQEFEVKFHYNLQAHGMINPKMAFLDILSNMLVMSFNNAPWWGGAARYTSSGNFGKPLGDHSLLAGGDLLGFMKSVVGDIGGMVSNIFGNGQGGFSLESVLGGIGDVAGDMLGGWLSENLNSPQGPQVANAFLSGQPTGKWHITVGNPLNPILMMGNMILDDTNFRLHGPLGRDDFPTELEVTLKFKHGRPRDKQEIEQMFNLGRGRLYAAPEGLEDVLNTAGKEPKRQSGYSKDSGPPFPRGGAGGLAGAAAAAAAAARNAGSGGTGNSSAKNRYRDDLESAWKLGTEAADTTVTKIKNVFRYAID
jgi:hypothetical protein